MTVIIRWLAPSGTNWTFSRVYNSNSYDGVYTLLASVAIGTYSYQDESGTTDTWYKISFWDGVNESSLSDPVRGGTEYIYATVSGVRSVCDVSTAEVSDNQVSNLIVDASEFIDHELGDARNHWERFYNQEDERILQMEDESSVNDFLKVEVGGTELFEIDKFELMDNNEMDEGDETTDTVEDWSSITVAGATYTWDTANPYKGRRCLKITKTAESDAYWYTTDSISVENTKAYKLRMFIKTVNVTAGTGNGAYIQIKWYNSSDELQSTDTGDYITGTNAYTEYSITAHAPWNANYAVVRCVHDGSGGDAYFDVGRFRKVNWRKDVTNARLELSETYPHKMIAVQYQRLSISNIIKNLCKYLVARACLLRVAGSSASGMSYRIDDFNVDKTGLGRNRIEAYGNFDVQIKEIFDSLKQRDDTYDADPDFDLGEVEF